MKLFQKAKKSLGQIFLIDNNIINKIVKIGNIDKSKTVMEIGAGYGNLTKAIASAGPKKIFAIEKDKKLALLLKNKFKNYDNIKIIFFSSDFFDGEKLCGFKPRIAKFGFLLKIFL